MCRAEKQKRMKSRERGRMGLGGRGSEEEEKKGGPGVLTIMPLASLSFFSFVPSCSIVSSASLLSYLEL